jgi:hypothetical protein
VPDDIIRGSHDEGDLLSRHRINDQRRTIVKGREPATLEFELGEIRGRSAELVKRGLALELEQKKGFAFDCFLKASTLGSAEGAYHVARCYQYGLGIPKNLPLAMIYNAQAEGRGHSEAHKQRDRIQEEGVVYPP